MQDDQSMPIAQHQYLWYENKKNNKTNGEGARHRWFFVTGAGYSKPVKVVFMAYHVSFLSIKICFIINFNYCY